MTLNRSPDSLCWSASWARRTPWCLLCVVASLDHAQIVSNCNKRKTGAVSSEPEILNSTRRRSDRSDEGERVLEGKFREFTIVSAAGRSPRRTGRFSMLSIGPMCFPASWLVADVTHPAVVMSLRVRTAAVQVDIGGGAVRSRSRVCASRWSHIRAKPYVPPTRPLNRL